MSMAMPSRTLPTISVFTHPNARLIKTVPHLEPPTRIDGQAPSDNIGVGRALSQDVVLTDVCGPFSIHVVPDPLDPTIATLVLSVHFSDPHRHGAARRFVLPFRSFQRDPISGQRVSQSKISHFDAADRTLYPGIGTGINGLDGGSFWFYEDIGEDGALDRYRRHKDGVASRAIWTVWLISAPAPVVHHVQALLQSYPAPLTPLPPWPREEKGYTSKDNFPALSSHPVSHPEYRNSLIAVENCTGQIIGVLASHICLDPASQEPDMPDQPSPASRTEPDAEANEDHEAITPLDEVIPSLPPKPSSQISGLHTEPLLLSKSLADKSSDQHERGALSSKPSNFVHHAASIYLDPDTQRSPSRPASVLAADTFAPPPLPPKHPPLGPVRRDPQNPAEEPASRRTSTVSAFYTAESDAEVMSSYDADAPELDASSITHGNLSSSSVSIRGHAWMNIEKHRPELLRDAVTSPDSDDESASDASGSTAGGPALRIWRKARGKSKKKPARAPQLAASPSARPPKRIASRRASEHSDRTSTAETASEAVSDDEAVQQTPDPNVKTDTSAHPEPPSGFGEDVVPLRSPQPSSLPDHHLPRSALRTDEVRAVEDRVWREAFDADQLPIDAPYTHLAARGEAGFYPSSILSSPRSVADGSAIELLSAEDKLRQVHCRKAELHKQNQRAERIKNMQGGTVLIEFLAGSTRIGASLIRSAGYEASSAPSGHAKDGKEADDVRGPLSAREEATSNIPTYVPLLPQHLLSFLGLGSRSAQQAQLEDAPCPLSQTTGARVSSYLSNLWMPSLGGLLTEASDWVTDLFGRISSSSGSEPRAGAGEPEALGDSSRAEDWEYAIPDFDPSSMAHTPRPIYRRARPVPSAMNGFNISGARNSAEAGKSGESPAIEPAAQPQRMKTLEASRLAPTDEQRYSILHIDSLGIGRRAFFRGTPELEGLRL